MFTSTNAHIHTNTHTYTRTHTHTHTHEHINKQTSTGPFAAAWRKGRGQYMLCHPCADVAFGFFMRDVGAVQVLLWRHACTQS